MESSFDWEDLLTGLERRNVVPVIGKELLTHTTDTGEQISVEQWLVSELLAHFKKRGSIGETEQELFHENMSLNEFTLCFMNLSRDSGKYENRKHSVKKKISQLLAGDTLQVPEVLQKLASIDLLDVFITTTPDTLLEQALTSSRGSNNSLAYKLRSAPEDIHTSINQPTVYHLFGSFDDNQDFCVTDEDMVEFLHSVSTTEMPRNLLDFISDKKLLLIGCGLSESLFPFLARTLVNNRLFPYKKYRVVDKSLSQNSQSALFWDGFAGEALVTSDAAEFVDELHERWLEDIGPSSSPGTITSNATTSIDTQIDDDAYHVFVSYRRGDQPAADKIVDALRSRDISVWYDKDNIEGGDTWMSEIKKHIATCMLFMPLLSKNSQAAENVSIEEWNLAFVRRRRINSELPFIIPVVLDAGIEKGADLIDEKFWEWDATNCIDGTIPDGFLDSVVRQLEESIKARKR